MMRPGYLLLLLVGAMSGCMSLAPDYQRPPLAVAERWSAETSAAAQTLHWRQFFLDQNLQQVIASALQHNRDLRVAAEAVLASEALYRVQRAARVPGLSAEANARHNREHGADVDSEAVAHSYGAGLVMSGFELDLFGRVRSLSEAQWQTYLASAAGAQATRISLIAATATAYLNHAASSSLLTIAEDTRDSTAKSLHLVSARMRLGLAARLDYSAVDTVHQQARADVARYRSQVEQARNALQLLCGSQLDPALLAAGLEQGGYTRQQLPVGLPSEVLLKRPDVQQAEHNLQARNASIGAARAAFFPRISLTAQAGVSSTAFSELVSQPTRVLGLAPSLNLPLLDGGSNRANLQYAESQQRSAIARYEQTLQSAFREVADLLAQQATLGEQLQAQQAYVDSAASSLYIAQARYRQGSDSYLDTLVAQRTLYAARQSLLATRLSDASSQVQLYAALGGGVE